MHKYELSARLPMAESPRAHGRVLLPLSVLLLLLITLPARGQEREFEDWKRMESGTSARLEDVWGSGPDDVWAVGFYETSADPAPVLHYDGKAWSEVPTGSTAVLSALWGNGPNDIYAVGGGSSPAEYGTVLHFDGTAWSEMNQTTKFLIAVWASGPDDVFVASGFGISHYDGSAWTDWSFLGTAVPAHSDIWGTGPLDVFVVGDSGLVRHFDGESWSRMAGGTSQNLRGMSGTSSTDAYTVSGGDTVLRYDGQVWLPVPDLQALGLRNIWVRSSSDIFAVGDDKGIYHYDGKRWTLMDAEGDWVSLRSVWSSGPFDAFAVGEKGTILHYAGPQYNLSCFASSAEGTVEPSFGWYRAGTQVTLTALAAAGWHFVSWSGDLESNQNPATITMSKELMIVDANFELDAPESAPGIPVGILGLGGEPASPGQTGADAQADTQASDDANRASPAAAGLAAGSGACMIASVLLLSAALVGWRACSTGRKAD